MVAGIIQVSFDTRANAMYYQVGKGNVARSGKLRANGLEYVLDYDARGGLIGIEVLNMRKALAVAAGEASLLLAPVRMRLLRRAGRTPALRVLTHQAEGDVPTARSESKGRVRRSDDILASPET